MTRFYVSRYQGHDDVAGGSPVLCYTVFGWTWHLSAMWRWRWPTDCTVAIAVDVWSVDRQRRRFAVAGWGWSGDDDKRLPIVPVAQWKRNRADGFLFGWLGFYLQFGAK